jgi:hypothetical protein
LLLIEDLKEQSDNLPIPTLGDIRTEGELFFALSFLQMSYSFGNTELKNSGFLNAEITRKKWKQLSILK